MSELTQEDRKYFVTNLNEALKLDLCDFAIKPNIIVTYDDYTLKYLDSPHHSETNFSFEGPGLKLIVSGELRSSDGFENYSEQPLRFAAGPVRFTEGEKFGSIYDLNYTFRILMACFKVYALDAESLKLYRDPQFRNEIIISMMQGVESLLIPEMHCQIPQGIWRAKA